jgi:hypothetical protein
MRIGSIEDIEVLQIWSDDDIGNQAIHLAMVERPVIMAKNVSVTAKQFQQFGEILGFLKACDIAREICTPQKWQKAVLPTLPKGRDAVKKATREWATGRWPKTNWKRTERSRIIWQDACDAAALAEYARMRAGGGR